MSTPVTVGLGHTTIDDVNHNHIAAQDIAAKDTASAGVDLRPRRSRKYLVGPALADAVVTELTAGGQAQLVTADGRREFHQRSVYFDTPELHSYMGTTNRRPHQFVVRFRRYVDTGGGHFEAQVSDGRGRTIRHRLAHDTHHDHRLHHRSLPLAARRFLAGIDETAAVVDWLAPTLIASYRRSIIAFEQLDSRATVDTDLCWQLPSGDRTRLADRVLITTESAGPPTPVDRLLWQLGARPSTIDKYCTGLAALVPGLPADRWQRVLAGFEPSHRRRRSLAA